MDVTILRWEGSGQCRKKMREQENNKCEGVGRTERRGTTGCGTWEKAGDKSAEGIEESGR